MAVVERFVLRIRDGKWDELWDLERRYDEIEGRYGFPPKRRYQALFGGGDFNTYIIEREWESLAVMEATQGKAFGDPEWEALDEPYYAVYAEGRRELYTLVQQTSTSPPG